MIQRMLNRVAIEVPEIDLFSVSDLEVTFDQRSSNVEVTYTGESITVIDGHNLVVEIPKADAMLFDNKNIDGQVMFTREDGTPDATEIFTASVAKLLKENGYGN